MLSKGKFNLPKGFTITAHTGCMGTVANSIDSIVKGIEAGAHIIEFDLNFNEKGTPVLSHDTPKGDEPTLEEAFECLSKFEGVKANVDVKAVDHLEKVYPLAKKYGVENRIFYTGVKAEFIDAVRSRSPQIAYFYNVGIERSKKHNREYIDTLIKQVQEVGAIGLNFNKKCASAELVRAFHESDLLVSIWTVNGRLKMRKILSLSPDNITTKKPDVLAKIIG